VSVLGMVQEPQVRSSGLVGGPTDAAEGRLATLSRVDTGRLQQQVDESLWPLFVNLRAQDPAQGDLPVPVPEPDLGEGNHLSYAGQWFIFALVVIVVLGIYVSQDSGEKPVQVKTAAREAVKPPEKLPESPPVEATQAPPVQQPEAAPQQAPAQAAAPEPQKQEAPPPAEKKEPPPPAAPAAGTLILKIEATEAAWVQVKADKKPAVQRLMQAGETFSTEARERITVDLGNAGGVQITFQGQSLGSPGKRGEVAHLIYPEGKRIERKKPEEPKPDGAVTKPAAE